MEHLCSGRASSSPAYGDKGQWIKTESEAESRMQQQLTLLTNSVQELSARIGTPNKSGGGAMTSFAQQLEQLKKDILAKLDSSVSDKDGQSSPPQVIPKAPDQSQAVQQPTDQLECLQRLERGIDTLLSRKSADATGAAAKGADAKGAEAKGFDAAPFKVLKDDLVEELKMHSQTMALFNTQMTAHLQKRVPSKESSMCETKQTSAPTSSVKDINAPSKAISAPAPSQVQAFANGAAQAPAPSQVQAFANGAAQDGSKQDYSAVVPSQGEAFANGASAAPASVPTEREVAAVESFEAIDKVIVEAEEVEDEDEDDEPVQTVVLREGNGLGDVFSADNALETPAYHVEDHYWETGLNQKIARANSFANFTVLVVIFNAVYIGFDSDYNDAQNIYKADWVFFACSQFFCVYFTWELLVRFLAFRKKRDSMRDGWFKFDTFLVSTMILDTWVLMPTLYFVGGGVQIPTQPLRMLRLFKLTRMARLMKAFPELVTMIKGLVRSLRAISSSMILIGLMVYVWAIMMHMLMKEEVEFNETLWRDYQLSFGTMTNCVWTLLVSGTLMLDNSSPLMSHLLFSKQFNYILAGIAFVSYALMSAMCILQMLIGVLCDVVSTVKQEETSAIAIGLMKQEILAHLQECPSVNNGKISQHELARVMKSPRSRALLRKLRINYPFFLELQKGAYAKATARVPIKDVLELMVMSRGDNLATVESMAGALVTIITEMGSVKAIIEKDITDIKKVLETDIMGLEQRVSAQIERLMIEQELQAKSSALLEHQLHEDIQHLERFAHISHDAADPSIIHDTADAV